MNVSQTLRQPLRGGKLWIDRVPAAIFSCSDLRRSFAADQKLHLSEFLKESDPFYPCAEQRPRHKGDCYLYAPTYFLSLHENRYADALEWCGGAEVAF